MVALEHRGALDTEKGLRLRQPAGQDRPVHGAREAHLVRGEDLQQVQGREGLLRAGEDHRGLRPGRERRAGLGLVHRDVRLLHGLPKGLHGGLRDGHLQLAAAAEGRRPATRSSPSGARPPSRSFSARSRGWRKPSPASTTPSCAATSSSPSRRTSPTGPRSSRASSPCSPRVSSWTSSLPAPSGTPSAGCSAP